MPDITMCENKECNLSSECYRFSAIPSYHIQTYLADPKKDCEDKAHQLFQQK
jgi:hypothetical protein